MTAERAQPSDHLHGGGSPLGADATFGVFTMRED
jgi:hypothetical protein